MTSTSIVLGVLIISIIILSCICYFNSKYPNEVIGYNQIVSNKRFNPNDYETGDILMFRFEHFDTNRDYVDSYWEYQKMIFSVIPTWPSIYTHISTIVKINGKPYILNLGPQSIMNMDGKYTHHVIDIYDLESYIMDYPGNVYHSKYLGDTIPECEYVNLLNKVRHKPFKANYLTGIDYVLGTNLSNSGPDTHMTCSGVSYFILNNMGILPNTTRPYNNYTPGQILNIAISTGLYTSPISIENKYLLNQLYTNNLKTKY